jgi:hypothetical protein
MAGIHVSLTDDPITCEVVEAVLGGQLVECRAASAGATQRPVGVAAAGSVVAVGVALIDASPFAASGTPLVVFPQPVATAVAAQGEIPGVTYAATATYGARLKCAALGKVTPWISGTDNPALIIGYCAEPAGVSAAATGRVRLIGLC